MRSWRIWLLLILAGCVFLEEYPEEWGPLPAPQSDCPGMAGTYVNRGTDYGGYLSDYFEADTPLKVLPTHIEIQQPDQDTLRMKYWHEKELAYAQVFSASAGDFSCNAGWIERKLPFITKGFAEKGGVGGFLGSITVRFVATPNYLVAEWSGSVAGGAAVIPNPVIPMLFPIAGFENHWYRFKRVQPEEPATSEK